MSVAKAKNLRHPGSAINVFSNLEDTKSMMSGVPIHRTVDYKPQLENDKLIETSVEYHLPGHRYLGPGTHILGNIRNRVKPINYADYIAFKHDIDYAIGVDPLWADVKAIARTIAQPTVSGLVMSIGLGLRSVLASIGSSNREFNYFDQFANSNYTDLQIQEMKEAYDDPSFIPIQRQKDTVFLAHNGDEL